jgi:asparagine synthase (glutamine-hydrolysing)
MCGIVGLQSSKKGNHEERLRKALDIQKHRGPDDNGLAIYPTYNVYLGQNRLSIIDLSSQGHQPFECFYKGFTYAIVYNGEVYNYLELRRTLISNGYIFRSMSDTEVILYAYIHWGVECVKLFRGMFAFAIWDSKNEFLFVGRDRFGIKPFVYSLTNGEFAFASEVKTLLTLTNGYDSGSINSSSIIDYFTFGSVRQPNTLYKNIFWLPKAHYGIYHRGELKLVKYWDLAQNAKILREANKKIEYEEAKSILLQKLEEATTFHMISDVKVGAFLSGGIDSTAVVALMARCQTDKIDTYTLGFDISNDLFPDETQIAQKTSLVLGTNHHALKLTKSNFLEKLPKFFASSDQPSIISFQNLFQKR